MRTDDQLDGDGPARSKGTPVSLLVEPVHGLEDLEELEHALEVAEHRVLPEVLLDQLPQGLWLVCVDHTLGEELMEANLGRNQHKNHNLLQPVMGFWKGPSMYSGDDCHLICCPTSFSRYSKLDFLSRAICGMSLKNLNVAEVRDMTRAGGK